MKKIFLMAIVATSILAACQQKTFTINGTIEGAKDGKAVLNNIVNGRPNALDTAEIVGGKFTFTGSVEEPQLYLIFIDGTRTPIVFFGENANINITADSKKLQEATITGSEITDIYTSFVKGIPAQGRMEEIQKEYQQAAARGDKESAEELKKEVYELMEEHKAYFLDFIKKNTTNIVGAYMAQQAVSEFKLEEFKELVGQFETNLGESKYVADLKKGLESLEKAANAEKNTAIGESESLEKAANAEKNTAIGEIAPDFTLKSADGKSVSLSSLRGKYLLVDFWASWCGPCRHENPNVVKAYAQYAPKGFDVLSVSLDRDPAAWKKAIADDNLTWTQVIDEKGSIAEMYAVKGIPFTLLLDKDGKIIAKKLRGEALDNKLAELLN